MAHDGDRPVSKKGELPYFGSDDRTAPLPEPPRMMRRVRVGLTGLACVFLLVMLATALISVATDRNGNLTDPSVNTAAPSEPLAQLGVAPGNPSIDPVPEPRAAKKH